MPAPSPRQVLRALAFGPAFAGFGCTCDGTCSLTPHQPRCAAVGPMGACAPIVSCPRTQPVIVQPDRQPGPVYADPPQLEPAPPMPEPPPSPTPSSPPPSPIKATQYTRYAWRVPGGR